MINLRSGLCTIRRRTSVASRHPPDIARIEIVVDLACGTMLVTAIGSSSAGSLESAAAVAVANNRDSRAMRIMMKCLSRNADVSPARAVYD